MFQASNSLTLNYIPNYIVAMNWKTRLKQTFELTGWTIAELSRRSNVSYDSVTKYLSGKVDQPRGNTLRKLAEALEVNEFWLETGVDIDAPTRRVPLKGYVGAGQFVEAIDNDQDETVEAPADARAGTVAAEVRGPSMLPMFPEGWLIYWSRHLPAAEMLNKLAVVQLAGGQILVKTIKKGTTEGFYTLTSTNALDMEDQLVEWAAPIDWIKPR